MNRAAKFTRLFSATVMLISIGVAGYFSYQLGLTQAVNLQHTTNSQHQTGTATNTTNSVKAPAANVEDPALWSIAQGEAATKRHMQTGLTAGQLDPVTGRTILYYQDPMVPSQQFTAPGKSPFMQMMLVPVYQGAAGKDAGTVSVSPRQQQNLGIRTALVTRGDISLQIAAIGQVQWDQRQEFLIQGRATGFVEQLFVNALYDQVQKDQPLFEVFVPDWIAAQQDYLSARRMQQQGVASLVNASRQRMRQAGMSEAQIATVEASQQLQSSFTIKAPAAGIVTELNIRSGSTIQLAMPLLRINAMDPIWIEAEVAASQSGYLRKGDAVQIKSPALPGQQLNAKISTLLPEIDSNNRTRKIRLVLANSQGLLVPGAVVQLTLSAAPKQDVLLIPTEALIRTGRRTMVILRQDGEFQPVNVSTGMEQGGQTEILSGLQAGQTVVVSGQFLLDSEASLSGALDRLSPTPATQETTTEPASPLSLEQALPAGTTALPQSTPANAVAIAAMPSTAAMVYQSSARIEAIGSDYLTLTHPAIPALAWPGMTMDFALSPQLQVPQLHVGDSIQIQFQLNADQQAVVDKITLSAPTKRHNTGDEQ